MSPQSGARAVPKYKIKTFQTKHATSPVTQYYRPHTETNIYRKNKSWRKKKNNKYKAIVLKTIVRQSFPSDEWIIDFFLLIDLEKGGGREGGYLFICLFVCFGMGSILLCYRRSFMFSLESFSFILDTARAQD